MMTTVLTAKDIESAWQYYRQHKARRRAQREAERQRWLQRVCEAVTRLAPQHSGVWRVILFGSLLQPARFGPASDIDVGVECDTVEAEVAFRRALGRELGRDVDVRPLVGRLAEIVAQIGEQVSG
jgi:predicted nucleotidyltransferase